MRSIVNIDVESLQRKEREATREADVLGDVSEDEEGVEGLP